MSTSWSKSLFRLAVFFILFSSANILFIFGPVKYFLWGCGNSWLDIFQLCSVDVSETVVEAVAKVQPAVVSVVKIRDWNRGDDLMGGGSGASGFLVASDGLVVTNKHVVSDGTDYQVITDDGESYRVEKVYLDPMNDLAILKINASGLPVVNMNENSNLRPGQTVIVIGNSMGIYNNSVTTGVISGLNRTIRFIDGDGSEVQWDSMIQTDATLNLGNSGGPLFDLSGRVIGINSFIDQTGDRLGFAVPVWQIITAVESIEKDGRIIRPRIGVSYSSLNPEISSRQNISVKYGALIIGVDSNGPAAVADLRENDIIVSVDNNEINQNNSFISILQKYKPGDEIDVEYVRSGKKGITKVILDEMT